MPVAYDMTQYFFRKSISVHYLCWTQVNLKFGIPENCGKEAYCSSEACTAGIGTLVLEFGILARLLKDPSYEKTARKAVDALWKFRSKETGLFGELSFIY